jgi:uncharacterized membrane protein
VGLFLAIDSWTLVTVLDLLLMAGLLRLCGMRMPAVYAFPFLAFVFPAASVLALPVAALVVSTVSFSLVLAYRLVRRAAARGHARRMSCVHRRRLGQFPAHSLSSVSHTS